MERGKKEEEDGVGGLFLPLPSEATFGFLADLFHVAACPQAIEEEEGGREGRLFSFPPCREHWKRRRRSIYYTTIHDA